MSEDWNDDIAETTQSERNKVAADLQQLAEVIRGNPNLPIPTDGYGLDFRHNIIVSKYDYNSETGKGETLYNRDLMLEYYRKVQKAAVATGLEVKQHIGDPTNEWDDPYTKITMDHGKVTFKIEVDRSRTCKKVEVGEKWVDGEEERVIPAKPGRYEKVYEYECDDKLAKVVVKPGERVS